MTCPFSNGYDLYHIVSIITQTLLRYLGLLDVNISSDHIIDTYIGINQKWDIYLKQHNGAYLSIYILCARLRTHSCIKDPQKPYLCAKHDWPCAAVNDSIEIWPNVHVQYRKLTGCPCCFCPMYVDYGLFIFCMWTYYNMSTSMTSLHYFKFIVWVNWTLCLHLLK